MAYEVQLAVHWKECREYRHGFLLEKDDDHP
jgi:hypothetical protein